MISTSFAHFDLCFKREAIAYSWELLTDVYGLPRDRLYVTYFEGDASNGLEPDMEAKQLWLDQGVHEDHILPGNTQDNFWGMCESYITTDSDQRL